MTLKKRSNKGSPKRTRSKITTKFSEKEEYYSSKCVIRRYTKCFQVEKTRLSCMMNRLQKGQNSPKENKTNMQDGLPIDSKEPVNFIHTSKVYGTDIFNDGSGQQPITKHKTISEHGYKKILTEEEYKEFFTAIIESGDIPHFLRSTYLNKDRNCICVDVTIDKSKAEEEMKHFAPKLFSDGLVIIHTIGKLEFAGCVNEAAGCIYNEQNITFQTNPGQKLHNIQAGKCISTINPSIVKDVTHGKIQFEKGFEPNEFAASRGTMGAIMQDSKSGLLYGITAQHFFNSLRGYQKGNTYTVCDVYRSENNQVPVPVQQCLSDKHVGCYGCYAKLEGVKDCAVDIAAFQLFSDLKNSEIFPYFEGPNGPVQMEVYRGCSNDMKGKPIQHKGAKSGEVKGEIIVEKMHVFFEGKFIGNNFFKVASDTEAFAVIGDSGSFITSDLSKSNCGSAYGILSFVETSTPCSPITAKNKEYNISAWCTRLNYGIDMLEKVGNLKLEFASPYHSQI